MKRRIIDKRRKGYFTVDDIYLNGYAKHCGINATGVYMILCRHSSKIQECFPSKKLIAQKLSISERSVYSAIKKLHQYNIVKIKNQGRKKDGSFKNLTYILVDKSEWLEILPQASSAVGKSSRRQEVQAPSATGAVSRRQQVPNKETHIEPYTYKETHINYSPISLKLAKLLYKLIKDNNPSWYVKPNWDNWAEDIDKINRLDNRTFEQIKWMIEWSQEDEFWSQNILSPTKLRKQFNQMVVKAKQNNKSKKWTII